MKLLIFVFVYPLIWLISLLPLSVLYLFSDLLYFITYYVVGYRKQVVLTNLKLAYPEKSEKELKLLSKKSLHHFTDFIFETIKTFTISKKELNKRYIFKNIDLFNSFEDSGRGIILMGSHYANWEWLNSLGNYTSLHPVASYTKITNKYFESVIKKSRERLGTNLIRSNELINKILHFQNEGKIGVYGLLSDQSPQLYRTHYWGTFLGQYVPVVTGAEFLAKKYNFVVLNALTTRVKRGYYTVEFEVLTTDPCENSGYEITDMYLKSTTNHINKAPEFYMWTHKRFKFVGQHKKWLEMKGLK